MDREELMRKIRALEEGQAELKRESQQPLAVAAAASPRRAAGLSRRHHAMVMQSLGQAVHVLDPYGKILYW
nr:unnamed protein product [Digitaria exilis]